MERLDMSDTGAVASQSFVNTLRAAAREAYNDREISRWELARINLASVFRRRALAEAQECVIAEAVQSGRFSASEEEMRGPGFDWDALLNFIRELLPLIMEIISLFN
jgi:hypothetical protein